MADVESSATLKVNVEGEDQVKELADSFDKLKSTVGSSTSSMGGALDSLVAKHTRTSAEILADQQQNATWWQQQRATLMAQGRSMRR